MHSHKPEIMPKFKKDKKLSTRIPFSAFRDGVLVAFKPTFTLRMLEDEVTEGEIQILSKIKDIYIVTFEKVMYDKQSIPYYIYNFDELTLSLQDILDKGVTDKDKENRNLLYRVITLHLVEGLRVLSENNLFHGDLRPCNVYIKRAGQGYVASLCMSTINKCSYDPIHLYKYTLEYLMYKSPRMLRNGLNFDVYTIFDDLYSIRVFLLVTQLGNDVIVEPSTVLSSPNVRDKHTQLCDYMSGLFGRFETMDDILYFTVANDTLKTCNGCNTLSDICKLIDDKVAENKPIDSDYVKSLITQ